MRSAALHVHPAKDALTHIEACLPFGAKIDVNQIIFETGGGATNNAVTFARFGKLKTAALTRVGADSSGRDIADALKQDNVDPSFIQIAKREQTAYATILLSGVGERTILVYRGASRTIDADKIFWSNLKARWFYVSSLGGDLTFLKRLISHAHRVGAKIAFNPGGAELNRGAKFLVPLFNKLDWLNMNREEAARLTGIPFAKLKEIFRAVKRFAKNVIITDGPRGAYAITSENLFFAPTLKTKPVNVTGAGDAFGSGFITGLIKKNDPVFALRLGTLNADSVIRHTGAKIGIRHSFPSHYELARTRVKQII